MNILKKAFTMVEIMAVFFIISIVVVVTLTAQKPFDKGFAILYNRAFYTLTTAIYNIKVDNTSSTILKDMTAIQLCNALASTSTATGGYYNVHSTTCNANEVPLTAADTAFTSANLQFTTSDGMKVYLSPVDSISVTLGTVTNTIGYRVVFFDLNGDLKPNTAVSSTTRMADIVGFLVTEYGDVLPVGAPEFDRRYLTAKVLFPDNDVEDDIDLYSDSMSYYDAKATAWGVAATNSNFEEIMSINFYADFPAGNLKVTAPGTYPAVDTVKGCVAATSDTISPCEVEFNQFIN